jgi:hypothetical protein
MNTTPRIPACRPRRSLLALAAAAAAFGAQAVPISVSISGLPPGLAPVLDIQRSTCPGSQVQWLNNPSQPLTEFSHTVIEPVTLPSGQMTLRSRVITVYTASFNTERTPGSFYISALEVRCTAIFSDLFHFSLRVPGLGNADQPASAGLSLGHVQQSNTAPINRTLAAKTTSFSPALNTLSRGVPQTVDTTHEASIGTVQGQRLDFLRPSTPSAGAFNRVASLFVRTSDSARCVQAGSTTRCLSGSTPVEAGGVRLHGLQRNVDGQAGKARFQFELLPSFPIGTLKLVASADASDLPAYIVDGVPQALDLLPWQPAMQTVSVQ